MRLRNIIQDYTIYVNNEEQDLLDKLPERAVDRATISEREQVIADQLIRKSLLKKLNNNGVILVQKNTAQKENPTT
jgi:hypothetical protein